MFRRRCSALPRPDRTSRRNAALVPGPNFCDSRLCHFYTPRGTLKPTGYRRLSLCNNYATNRSPSKDIQGFAGTSMEVSCVPSSACPSCTAEPGYWRRSARERQRCTDAVLPAASGAISRVWCSPPHAGETRPGKEERMGRLGNRTQSCKLDSSGGRR